MTNKKFSNNFSEFSKAMYEFDEAMSSLFPELEEAQASVKTRLKGIDPAFSANSAWKAFYLFNALWRHASVLSRELHSLKKLVFETEITPRRGDLERTITKTKDVTDLTKKMNEDFKRFNATLCPSSDDIERTARLIVLEINSESLELSIKSWISAFDEFMKDLTILNKSLADLEDFGPPF